MNNNLDRLELAFGKTIKKKEGQGSSKSMYLKRLDEMVQ